MEHIFRNGIKRNIGEFRIQLVRCSTNANISCSSGSSEVTSFWAWTNGFQSPQIIALGLDHWGNFSPILLAVSFLKHIEAL